MVFPYARDEFSCSCPNCGKFLVVTVKLVNREDSESFKQSERLKFDNPEGLVLAGDMKDIKRSQQMDGLRQAWVLAHTKIKAKAEKIHEIFSSYGVDR